MSDKAFDRAAELFLDKVVAEEYFSTRSSERARRILDRLIQENQTPLIFLLGEPGSGKTQMVKLLEKELPQKGRVPILFDDPFCDRSALLQKLAQKVGIETDANDERLKQRLCRVYGEYPHLIIFDEAQLLTFEVLEFIRILSDTGEFRFLLAMHRKEGEAILAKPHFRSRPHRVVETGMLDEEEILHYLQLKFREAGLHELIDLMDRHQIKKLHRLSRGNFRMTKRLLHAAFSLMHEAQKRNMQRYARPCDTIWCMAAIQTGAEDA